MAIAVLVAIGVAVLISAIALRINGWFGIIITNFCTVMICWAAFQFWTIISAEQRKDDYSDLKAEIGYIVRNEDFDEFKKDEKLAGLIDGATSILQRKQSRKLLYIHRQRVKHNLGIDLDKICWVTGGNILGGGEAGIKNSDSYDKLKDAYKAKIEAETNAEIRLDTEALCRQISTRLQKGLRPKIELFCDSESNIMTIKLRWIIIAIGNS